MKSKLFFLAVVLFVPVLILSGSPAKAADGFLDGTGVWSTYNEGYTPPTTDLSWSVSWDGTSEYVHYSYTLNVNQHDISHFTLELSDGFTSDDIYNVTVNGAAGSYDIKADSTTSTYYQGGDVPHNTMPGDMYGIKIDTDEATSVTIEFDSTRMPEWGDFYARCGSRTQHELPKDDENWKQWNSAWNQGFASGEAAGSGNDPIVAASSGSYLNHILTPDTEGPTGDAFTYSGSLTMVPEPISSTLFIVGGGLLAGRRYRRRKK